MTTKASRWLQSRRNQMLVGGCCGALAGGVFGHSMDSAQPLVPVFVGFALGQCVAVLLGALRRRDDPG